MVNTLSLIIKKLHKKTINEGVLWEETETNNEFQVAFPQYSVRVSELYDSWGDSHGAFEISIFNEKGNQIESADSDELRNKHDEHDLADMLISLHEMARRRALRVDESLEDLLGYLNSSEEE